MKRAAGLLSVYDLPRAIARSRYYLQNVLRDITPQVFFRSRLENIVTQLGRRDGDDTVDLVNYYNQTCQAFTLGEASTTISAIQTNPSMYYYDLKQYARYFPRHFRLRYLFGDVTSVPETPTFVKSRPIAGNNDNSVLLNLEKARHFFFPHDPIPFEAKAGMAVWRGTLHRKNLKRRALLERYRDHPLCDVGYTKSKEREDSPPSAYLPPRAQMRYRYIVSVEGNDVATNLKWILASNSLCLMPRPVYETWFMEGRLEAGRCFVPLRNDFADLEDKICYYETHPDEARAIIRNANRTVEGFQDARKERLISLLVMYKYFVLSGQLEPDESVWSALRGAITPA